MKNIEDKDLFTCEGYGTVKLCYLKLQISQLLSILKNRTHKSASYLNSKTDFITETCALNPLKLYIYADIRILYHLYSAILLVLLNEYIVY